MTNVVEEQQPVKKTKILTISDNPLATSGVALQTKYMIEEMLKTGKYSFVSLGGAVHSPEKRPIITEEFKEDWIIYPVDGFGSQEIVRMVISEHKPDIMWIMSDPRFYGWLWEIENEIRANVPLVYYTIWDNYPIPKFNKTMYESNDVLVPISKLTEHVVRSVTPEVMCRRIPHTQDDKIFKTLPKEDVEKFKFTKAPMLKDKFVFFWNNRNARRKQPGTLIYWFKKFLDKVGHDKATLILHTDPKDQVGQNLEVIVKDFGLDKGQVIFSVQKLSKEEMVMMYNLADCTINIADAEGWGLSSQESLFCGTPIISIKTGGLQDQITDGTNTFGICLEPVSKTIVGTQEVPYIFEDRLSEEQFVEALETMFNMPKEERERLGKLGQEYMLKEYNFKDFVKSWDELFEEITEKFGSWPNKLYKRWRLTEV